MSWLEGEPHTQHEIELTEDALIRFAQEYAEPPSVLVKQSILAKLSKLNTDRKNKSPIDLRDLPLLEANLNMFDWEEAVKEIKPPDNFGDIHLHSLEATPQRQLFIVWVRSMIAEEVHHDLVESFILLEGTCECNITDACGDTRIVRMVAGDYIEMIPGESHNVVITSPIPAKAILQWRKIA